MDKMVQDELNTIKEIIIDTIPVMQIFLFGSHAYGMPESDSDLDIYVVMSDDANIREIDAVKLVRRAIRDKKTMPVDVVVSKEHKFTERVMAPTIERQIKEEGVMLYG